MSAGDARATLVEAPVGPQVGEAQIHVSARDGSSSLLPITARQSALFPGTAEAGIATIRVLRLADALPAADIAAPALLKRGVQGFELQALAGCEDVLERFAWVYAECSFQELYAGQSFADEVTRLLEAAANLKHRAALTRSRRCSGIRIAYNSCRNRPHRAAQSGPERPEWLSEFHG